LSSIRAPEIDEAPPTSMRDYIDVKITEESNINVKMVDACCMTDSDEKIKV
jgi:hypothetical protein